MNPGEYTSPLVRKTQVQCPVISGYVTARLYSNDDIPVAISGVPATQMLVTFENVGNTQFAVNLQETADRSVSGVRYTLNNAPINLVPGGQVTALLGGSLPFLEVYCTGTTSGELRMQIDSQRQWRELGFAKDDPFYPTQLWQAIVQPGAYGS